MAGGFGLRRCSSKAQEEAAAAAAATAVGKMGPIKGCSSKRKAKAAAAASGKIGPMKGCSSKRKAKAAPATCQLDGSATKRKAEEVEAAKPAEALAVAVEVAADGGDGEEAPAREGYTRLQQDEVDMILSMKACSIKPDDEETLKLFSQKTIDETSEAIREAAEVSEVSKQKFLEFQDFVRGEFEEKGYVEVPDEFLISRAELQDWLQEEVDKMFASLDIPDRYFANDSDDDEEEEVAL